MGSNKSNPPEGEERSESRIMETSSIMAGKTYQVTKNKQKEVWHSRTSGGSGSRVVSWTKFYSWTTWLPPIYLITNEKSIKYK